MMIVGPFCGARRNVQETYGAGVNIEGTVLAELSRESHETSKWKCHRVSLLSNL